MAKCEFDTLRTKERYAPWYFHESAYPMATWFAYNKRALAVDHKFIRSVVIVEGYAWPSMAERHKHFVIFTASSYK